MNVQDILPFVEKPSRYLGSEANTIKKDLSRVKLRMVLAFPDLYEIGTSHFGLQILYNILNRRSDTAAERVFAPGPDMEARLRAAGLPLASLESRRPLSEFHIIGFSLLYELNYTNVLTILALSGIPFKSADRDDRFPLIVAGGPCTCNPEPVAEIFDAMVVGDGEQTVIAMADAWIDWHERGRRGDRQTLLRSWAAIEGVYIPSFYQPEIDAAGFQHLHLKTAGVGRVRRAVVPDLNDAAFPGRPVVPFGRPVHDRLRLEVSRGCTRGCRFCQAGMIYRPVRERSPARLLDQAREALCATGYEDLSLMSLSTGDYSCLDGLMRDVMAYCEPLRVAVSLPSVRAGALTTDTMERIRRVRKTGFTIAPEAGSQRLRDVINKTITESDIMETVSQAFELGWRVIKLYFMIGLPTETEADIAAIADLVKRLKRIKPESGRPGTITVSATTFIPKPHTPFQWAPQLSLSEARERLQWLKHRVTSPRVQFKWQDPKVSVIEGLWSRGDRRLTDLLLAAYARGCRLDGWSDHFQYDRWLEAAAATGIDIDFFTTRRRQLDEPLPWDHIDMRVDTAYLVHEWHQAWSGAPTADCRWGDCQGCGVCDFERVQPVVHRSTDDAPAAKGTPRFDGPFQTVRCEYAKSGEARFFGHLEMVNLFLRGFRRAGIPVRYTAGFHPKPKISFADPLPVGMESESERFFIDVPADSIPERIGMSVNRYLPEGLSIVGVDAVSGRKAHPVETAVLYEITLSGESFDPGRLRVFQAADAVWTAPSKQKGKLQKRNLKDMVIVAELPAPNRLLLELRREPGKTVRPSEVLATVFGMTRDATARARIVKKKRPEAGMGR